MEVKRIAVVGTGQLGNGIVQVAIRSGYPVVMRDISEDLVQRGYHEVQDGLERMVARNQMDEATKAQVLGRLTTSTDPASARDADVVIEAVSERPEIKKRVFAELDGICPPHTIFASNTSSIPITKLGSATKRPDKVIGMHFIHPVPVIRSLTIVRGYLTSEDTFQTIYALAKAMDREPIRTDRDYAHGSQYLKGRNDELDGIPRLNILLWDLMEGKRTVEEIEAMKDVGVGGGMPSSSSLRPLRYWLPWA